MGKITDADIAQAARGTAQLDRFIETRAEQRDPHEPTLDDLERASSENRRRRRQEANGARWFAFHESMAETHSSLAEQHRELASRYLREARGG